jgi:DNA-binding NarL/FixJ family response regulator
MSPSQRPTRRELRVLAAVLECGSQKAAAYELGISEQTVKNMTSGLYHKLHVCNASSAARQLGWLIVPKC